MAALKKQRKHAPKLNLKLEKENIAPAMEDGDSRWYDSMITEIFTTTKTPKVLIIITNSSSNSRSSNSRSRSYLQHHQLIIHNAFRYLMFKQFNNIHMHNSSNNHQQWCTAHSRAGWLTAQHCES